MRPIQRVGTVLILISAGFTSAKTSAQEKAPPNSPRAGQAAPVDYDGGTGLLKVEQIQKELKLDPEQVASLLTILRETGEQMRGLYEGLGNLTEEERRARFESMNEKIKEIAKSTLAKVKEVLQPQQLDRLNQIKLQLQMRRGGGMVDADAVSAALELSDADRNKLRERERKIAEELREKIAQLQQEARAQVLETLTPEQRAKLDTMLGEPFEFQWGQKGLGGPPAQP
jgi:Spy/CpxP family protein refolding chaperone